MSLVLNCLASVGGTFLLIMGLTALYSAFFNRSALVHGHPEASPAITAGIAIVMGSIITYIGFSLVWSVVG